MSDGLAIPIKSAENGVLLRTSSSGPTYLSFDGQKRVLFNLSQVPGMANAVAQDFASDGGGVILLLTNTKEDGQAEYAIAKFDVDGTFRAVDKIDLKGHDFVPYKIAAFSSGEFLIAGSKEDRHAAATLLFNDRGQLLRELKLEGDITFPQDRSDNDQHLSDNDPHANRVPQKFSPQTATGPIRFMLDLNTSMVDRTDEGDVYLLRRDLSGPMFLIHSNGEVHRVQLPAPIGANRLYAAKVSKHTIGALYSLHRLGNSQPEGIVVVSDLEGNKLHEYTYSSTGVGFALADYNPDTITLVTTTGPAMAFVNLFPEE
jgi:hypothetical protein